ncbi:MAG TPA: hypothetical protein VGI17_07685 [Solirubrobacterales bacterium]
MRRYPVPTVILGVAVALLALAAPAAAEVRTGQITSAVDEMISGEADLLGATASYDSTTGSVTFTVTTREAPLLTDETLALGVGLATGATCTDPLMAIAGRFDEEGTATWRERLGPGVETEPMPAIKSISGAITTLSASGSTLENRPYVCAQAFVAEIGPAPEERLKEPFLDEVSFPISGPPKSIPPPSSPPTTTIPTPTPKPAALAIGTPHPLKLRTGRWRKVVVEVSDPGDTATGPVTLKMKASAGVVLKPRSGRLKLPALQPGQTRTVGFRVKLAAKAKARSTIALTATAPGLIAKASMMVRALGG